MNSIPRHTASTHRAGRLTVPTILGGFPTVQTDPARRVRARADNSLIAQRARVAAWSAQQADTVQVPRIVLTSSVPLVGTR